MRRLVLAIIVATLTISASGLTSLVVNEPCVTAERPGRDEGACPPTCVTCGCCAQAVEPVAIAISATPASLIAGIPDVLPAVQPATPRDILHVPKLRFA